MTFLMIDIQEKFRTVIENFDQIIKNSKKLIKVSELFDKPLLVTEQYPKGLGKTAKELNINKEFVNKAFEKTAFDCFEQGGFEKHIKSKTLYILGIETHICILQTALSALRRGYEVQVICDATGSRNIYDKEIALRRMERDGIKLTTTETLLFQFLKDSKAKQFEDIRKLI